MIWRLYKYHGQPLPEADPFGTLRAGSGPLLDRIDNHIDVTRVEYEKLSNDRVGEPSASFGPTKTGAIQARVEAARESQRADDSRSCHSSGGTASVQCWLGALSAAIWDALGKNPK